MVFLISPNAGHCVWYTLCVPPLGGHCQIFNRREANMNVEQATVTVESASHILWSAFSDLDNDYGKNITPKY
jgi:hypothetical protein